MRRAILHGCVVASYTVEAFGVDRVRALQEPEVDGRLRELHSFIQVDRDASDRHLFEQAATRGSTFSNARRLVSE